MLNLQCQWQYTLLLSLQLLTRPFSEIATTQLVGGTTHKLRPSVKIVDGGLNFYFSLFILFYSFFSFLFLEQLRLGFISHAVTAVTSWWRSHKTDHRTWEKEVEGFRIKWCHTAWTTHASLMTYTWSFRVGCTVVSTDYE